MAKRKQPPKKKPSKRSAGEITVRRLRGQDAFELVYPPCVRRRAEDMEEVRAMLRAGEVDVAEDELRWLLEGCRQLLEAHKLLGEIALADGDVPLGRAHFGYAYDLGLKALPRGGLPGVLPYARPANRPFFDAAKGLVQCIRHQGQPEPAREIVRQLLALDPDDPLELKNLFGKEDGR